MGTFTGDRYSYYQDPNYDVVRRNVLDELNGITSKLGIFPLTSQPDLVLALA